MSAKTVLILTTLAYISQETCTGIKLPPYIKACSKNDPELNKCAVKQGTEALPYVIKGDSKYRAPVLDPFTVSEVRVEHGDGSVGLSMIFKNVTITGLKNTKIRYIKIDLKSRRINSSYTVDRVEVISKYEVNGRILVLPITGKGDCNITLLDNVIKYIFTYDLIKNKDDLEYMNITSIDLKFQPNGAKFHLTNLFNGDKFLGDNMNIFLNENWREVSNELSPSITEVVKEILRNLSNEITVNIPYDEIFPNDK